MPNASLCVTVTAPTVAELRRRRDEATEADLVELRLDTVADPDVAAALAGRKRPVIVTCRPAWEGGRFTGSESERHRILSAGLALGADYVDVEFRAGFDDLIAADDGRRTIVSMHDFEGVPGDLAARAQAMRATGAAMVKIAVATSRLADCLPLLEIGRRGGDWVLIGMGEHGLATRVLAAQFGSRWTYAGDERQVGQISARDLRELYRFGRITSRTDVYGLVGSPVAHSVSPWMHNAAFEAAGLDAVYLPFRPTDADDFLAFASALGVKGASVTIPFKVALFDRVDEPDPVSRRVGAINTLRAVDGRLIGANTDVAAFLEPLRDRVPLTGARVAVLGAGGAARAVVIALAPTRAIVTVHARDRRHADDVARTVGARSGPFQPEPGSWDLLVNCTPIGMHPYVDETPIDAAALSGACVYDLVYNPPTTRLLREAALAGCQTIGGLEMLVAQAHEQYRWWTGARAPSGVMRKAALRRLAEFMRDENHVV
jgi:3-dehydroquinate dehydratase/shikimate dehydrogenase